MRKLPAATWLREEMLLEINSTRLACFFKICPDNVLLLDDLQ